MYVKSLTLRGFKSFASATSMRLEPGITCIVGPNGSGKSNVVDALAWVMGEQGAKSLRGGKMEDVIFAGTSGRAPLGRAEVALTIDNTDGALPIDYTEVTIKRTMFRNGGSDYSINGTSCRLLDVQELLSDSGIGREMHVIVGQGQLDAVLRATPEERRGFIEEAAGVLKHRKRKERALRKLETMEVNLTRVHDLTGEIRRQLGPLGRQAEAARKAAVIQADARDARLRLLADDLVQLTSTLEQEVADETALVARRTEVEEALAGVRTRLGRAGAGGAGGGARAGPRPGAVVRPVLAAGAADVDAVAGRRAGAPALRGRHRGAAAPGATPSSCARRPRRCVEQEQALLAEIVEAKEALAAAVGHRAETESAHTAEQQRLARLVRAAADRREGLAKLAGQVGARRSRIEAGEAEIGRLRASLEQSRSRAAAAEREFADLEASVAVEEEGEEGLDTAYERAAAEHEQAEAEVERWREAERAADSDRSSAAARLEALELSLRRKDGAAALLAATDRRPGMQRLRGRPAAGGHRRTRRRSRRPSAGPPTRVAVDTVEAAAGAVSLLREDDAGRAVAARRRVGAAGRPRRAWPALPVGARWARDVVTCPEGLRPAVDQLLERVALVDGTAAALELTGRGEGVTAVTADGDVFGPGVVRGGSASAPSLIEVQAAVDETRQTPRRRRTPRGAGPVRPRRRAGAARARRRRRRAARSSGCTSPTPGWRRWPSGSASSAPRSAPPAARPSAPSRPSPTAERALVSDREELAALQQRLDDASAEPGEEEPSTDERDRLDAGRDGRPGRRDRAAPHPAHRGRSAPGRWPGAPTPCESAARSELRGPRAGRRAPGAAPPGGDGGRGGAPGRVVRRRRGHAPRWSWPPRRGRRPRRPAPSARRPWPPSAARSAPCGDELRELTDSVHRDEVARTQQRLRIETAADQGASRSSASTPTCWWRTSARTSWCPSCPTPR